MGRIIVYNTKNEDHSSEPNNFYIGRPSPLSNPYTHDGKKSSLAKLSFKTREEAIDAYKLYFDAMYGTDPSFTKAFDEIYQMYSSGSDVYLQCFCAPLPCHGDYIAEKIQKKYIHEQKQKLKDKQ